MKNSTLKTLTSVSLIAALGMSACSAAGTTNTANSTTHESTSGSKNSAEAADVKSQQANTQTHFTAEDLTWDTASEVAIDLANPVTANGVSVEDGVLTITEAGNYRLSGQYSGQVKVAADKADAVRLILDNATITNPTGAAINVDSAGETTIYTAAGTTNTVTDGTEYAATGEDDPDAAIYSRANLTLAGEGTLKVAGDHEDGVHTTDGLVVANGTLEVSATNTGIKGKDYVDILGGTVTVTAQKDGIKSTNTDDDGMGFTRLSDGTVTISAADDGFKASRTIEITGGKLTVEKSEEGMEAQYINIVGGDVAITSTDDGINASVKDSSSDSSSDENATTETTETAGVQGGQAAPAPHQNGTAQDGGMGQPPAGGSVPGGGGGNGTFEVVDADITISGGTVTVNAEGDGIDSNGTATFSGGTVTVNGPSAGGNSAIDANGDVLFNGATITTGSTADMFEPPASASTSGYLKITDASALTRGATVQVTDSTGAVVAHYTVTTSNVQLVLISSTAVVKGQSYTAYVSGAGVDANSTTVAAGATELGSFTAA